MNADDELVVNLIVISKVQINTKLYTSGIYLNLEQPSYIPESVRRWIRQDSRDETIKKINRIVYVYTVKYKLYLFFINRKLINQYATVHSKCRRYCCQTILVVCQSVEVHVS